MASYIPASYAPTAAPPWNITVLCSGMTITSAVRELFGLPLLSLIVDQNLTWQRPDHLADGVVIERVDNSWPSRETGSPPTMYTSC